MKPNDLSVYHERTRRRGIFRPVYWPVRLILVPAIRLYFWLGRIGREHVPAEGAVIIAANHRSFLDPFAIGTCVRRPVFFVAKKELFHNRFVGWLLNCLGAFPVRRGESDEETVETAKAILAEGGAVVMFPEGTRMRSGSLGQPRRGVGRLALETGAAVVPVAILGSERARRGLVIRPCHVRVRFGHPLTFPRLDPASPRLAGEVAARIWPCVELQWEWLGGLPPLRKAAVVGAGPMGTAIAALLARAGLEVQLGCRTAAQAERIGAAGENHERLPGVRLPDGVRPSTVGEIEFAGVDLVVFAVPSAALPSAVGAVADRVGQRSAVLVLSKGLVAPLGRRPTEYVAERVRSRAVACLGGPAFAREAVEHGASVVLAAAEPSFRRQMAEALANTGLSVDATDDVTGVELAGVAKNAAALAAAAASPWGMNAAGAAAARVMSEVQGLASRQGGRTTTFLGLAGTGDLVATALAVDSRNRRAGELIGRGASPDETAAMIEGSAEALHTVPLLADLLAERGLEAQAVAGLRDLIEGRTAPEQWAASMRSGPAVASRRAA